MSDQTIDVGAIRRVATAWPPEEPASGSRVSPPALARSAFDTPADTPAPPVPVLTVGTSPVTLPAESWTTKVSGLAEILRMALRRHHSDVWVLAGCLLTAVVGIATMGLLDAFGPASWVALGSVVCVALRTRTQMDGTVHPQLFPVLRSLAVAFAATAVLTPVGLATAGELRAAAWVLATAGLALTAVLILRGRLRRAPRVVVVGDRTAVSRAAMRWSDGSVHVVGGVLAGSEETHLHAIVGVPTIAGLDHVADWALGRRADLVIVAAGEVMTGQQVRQLAWSLERSGVRVAVADLVSDVAPHRVRARRLGRTTVVELTSTRRGALTRIVKGIVDRVLGALLLLCAAPFLGAMMVLIRLDSPGTALFRQVRIGRGGVPFTMYKLRTMRADAEGQLVSLRDQNEGAGVLFKMQHDPRITRVGRLLRRTSMDELPQLINVVKGQMSLVGPRPALPCEVAEYDALEYRRLAVKPGMTGLWQVSGRSNLDWETSIALDLDYVDNWRLGDDLAIGLRTVGAVMGARGAY